MEKKFARFFTAIRESFKERHVPIIDLASHLSGYRVFPAVMKRDGPKLLADYQGDLSSANSINEIFEIVSRFVSFLDFEILEDMITYFGAHNDKQSWADYIKSVQLFLDTWKVKPCKIIHHESGSQAKLYIKLDTESLSKYQNVKTAIAHILGVQIHALQLCSIKDGCIVVVFLFPKVAVPSILPLKSLSNKFSEVESQILRITLSLVDEIVLQDEPPLILNWRRKKGVPFKAGGPNQSVVIGDSVFIGEWWGGRVTKLDLKSNEWTKLPLYSTRRFAMTSLDDQLVLVGGEILEELPRGTIKLLKASDQIGVFTSEGWSYPYPRMKIARYSSTAVGFNNHIIVAGGRDNPGSMSSVEVLDMTTKIWYIAEPIPRARSDMRSALQESTLYLMGGWNHVGSHTKEVHAVDLNKLLATLESKYTTSGSSIWTTIEDTPLNHSIPLSVGDSLFAVGGQSDNEKLSSSIHLYQPDTRRWVKVGYLPIAQYNCTCSVLSSGEFEAIVVSGTSESIDNVDFLLISKAQ